MEIILAGKLKISLLFLLLIFASNCSRTYVILKYKETNDPQIVLELKNADLYFRKSDVLEKVKTKIINDERIKKIFEKIKEDKRHIIYTKDFFNENVVMTEEETENYILLNEVTIQLFKEGKVKVYSKENFTFVEKIIMEKFNPKYGSSGYNFYFSDKSRFYTIITSIKN